MSYCRWSSDGFQCDLYCYEDVTGGWTTHVAARRRRERISPDFQDIIKMPREQWNAALKLYNAELTKALSAEDHPPIGLPYDGETFNDPTLEAFLERVIMLRDAGYKMPSYLIPNIEQEIAEDHAASKENNQTPPIV